MSQHLSIEVGGLLVNNLLSTFVDKTFLISPGMVADWSEIEKSKKNYFPVSALLVISFIFNPKI